MSGVVAAQLTRGGRNGRIVNEHCLQAAAGTPFAGFESADLQPGAVAGITFVLREIDRGGLFGYC